jgi:hypothetical protein
MKKFILAVAVSTIAIQLKGQYFEMRQSPTAQGHRLSSGTRLTAPLGDLMTSYEPVTAPANMGGFNFYITEKALPLPYGSGGTNQRGYKVFVSPQGCSGSQTLLSNMSGLTALQVNTTVSGQPIADLALAGSCREGCFFATFNRLVLTAPPSKMFYPFPGVSAAQPSKPLMVQSSTAYHYYICGSFQQDMYVIKVNENGGVIWSQFYSSWNHSDGYNHAMAPGAIIEDPYAPGDIVIAGSVEVPGRDSEGFLLKLSGSSGNVNLYTTYGRPGPGFEAFNTIVPASAGNNTAAGYLVGGGASNFKRGIKPWVLKLNVNGGVIWSRLISSAFDANANAVLSINERVNPSSGRTEYYSLLNSTVGFIVGKLDESGHPIHISDPSKKSEFGYNISTGEFASPSNLSVENGTVGLPPTGIHVYGTLNTSVTNQVFIASAYFNGVSGCEALANLAGSEEILTQPNLDPYFVYDGLQPCANITIQNISNGGGFYGCGGGLSSNGSNQRSAPVLSGLGESDGSVQSINVFPNPVHGVAEITLPSSPGGDTRILVYDISGRVVFDSSVSDTGAGTEPNYKLDFRSMHIEPGIYLIHVLSDGLSLQRKIIYTG